MTCVNNSCCYANWPCQNSVLVGSGAALLASAFVVGLLTVLVAKGALGQAQVGVGGAVMLSFVTLALSAVGGILIGIGGPKKTLPPPTQ